MAVQSPPPRRVVASVRTTIATRPCTRASNHAKCPSVRLCLQARGEWEREEEGYRDSYLPRRINPLLCAQIRAQASPRSQCSLRRPSSHRAQQRIVSRLRLRVCVTSAVSLLNLCGLPTPTPCRPSLNGCVCARVPRQGNKCEREQSKKSSSQLGGPTILQSSRDDAYRHQFGQAARIPPGGSTAVPSQLPACLAVNRVGETMVSSACGSAAAQSLSKSRRYSSATRPCRPSSSSRHRSQRACSSTCSTDLVCRDDCPHCTKCPLTLGSTAYSSGRPQSRTHPFALASPTWRRYCSRHVLPWPLPPQTSEPPRPRQHRLALCSAVC